jgi:predicted RNase H-like HicB family nuclease
MDETNLPDDEGVYAHPSEVLEDRNLTTSRKREILAAWASDAAAVNSNPSLRKLYPGSSLASIDEIMAALARLDALEATSDAAGAARGGSRMSEGLASDLTEFMNGNRRRERFIGLFRTDPDAGAWRVTFPDLPGCEATGKSFKDVYEAAQVALADVLSGTFSHRRPRSTVELLIDANRDRKLQRELAVSAMHPVEPSPSPAAASWTGPRRFDPHIGHAI